MSKKILLSIAIVFLLTGGLVGYLIFDILNPSFRKLSIDEIRQKIFEERDYAISLAIASGEYRCCINPPCTMCFMEANKWNNGYAGTCACDDFIARGEDPCPQCRKGLTDIHSKDNIFCDANALTSTCESQKEK